MDADELIVTISDADRLAIEELSNQEFMASVNVEALVAEYRDTRDDLALKRKQWKKDQVDAKTKMAIIAMKLRRLSEIMGVNSFSTDAGTAYKTNKESVRVGNWDQALTYIRETGNWQMLEKRLGKLATLEIFKSTGVMPPGVEYSQEIEFVVRKS